MKSLWSMYPALLEWETCNDIITHANKIRPVDANIGTARQVNPSVRASTVRWINYENEDFTDVWKFIERKFKQANAENFGVNIDYLPPLQFTTYSHTPEADGHYDWHVDIFWEAGNLSDRKLSMVIQLSDPKDYDGGELQFEGVTVHPDPKEFKQRGSVIIFPSFVKHRVTPVTRGTRHSLVGWIQGPTWR